MAKKVNISANAPFLASVYLLLAVQMSITALVVTWLRGRPDIYEKVKKYFWAWFLLSLVLIIALSFFPDIPMLFKLLLFTAFSVTMGLTSIAASTRISIDVIKVAIFSTIGVFIAMTVIGFVLTSMGIDLSFMSLALLLALVAVVIASIVMMFVKVDKTIYKAFVILIIVIFSIFIAYDTNLMLQRKLGVVDSALGLYLDMLNLFSSFTALGNE